MRERKKRVMMEERMMIASLKGIHSKPQFLDKYIRNPGITFGLEQAIIRV